MPTIYCDGEKTGGANTGVSWDTALEGEAGLQLALTSRAAGEPLWITRTFTLTGLLDMSNIVGSQDVWGDILGFDYNGGSHVQRSTGNDPAVIDANGAAANCFFFQPGAQYLHVRDVAFINATGAGWQSNGNTATYLNAVRCKFNNNGGHGIHGFDSGMRIQNAILSLCEAKGNGDSGIELSNNCTTWGCVVSGNGVAGIWLSSFGTIIDCVGFENTDRNLYVSGFQPVIVGNTADEGDSYGINAVYFGLVACNRATNAGIDGILLTRGGELPYNVSLDATGDEIGTPTNNANYSTDAGVETSIVVGDQGYADASGDNYTLRKGAAGFRRVIALDANTTMVCSSGVNNSLIVWAGGSL